MLASRKMNTVTYGLIPVTNGHLKWPAVTGPGEKLVGYGAGVNRQKGALEKAPPCSRLHNIPRIPLLCFTLNPSQNHTLADAAGVCFTLSNKKLPRSLHQDG